MASFRGVTVLLEWTIVVAAALALLAPLTEAQNCPNIIQTVPGVSSGFEDTVEIEFTLDETTPSGTDLYMVTWKDDCVEPPDIGDKEFTKYFTVNDTEDCTWWVSVNTELIGVPDYPDSTVSLETTVTFEGFTNLAYEKCYVTMRHFITDENTQIPTPQLTTYTLDIKEDLSVGYTIADFNMSVHDSDFSAPNNQFSVSMDAGCPLKATRDVYTSGEYPREVEYELREAVDYEASNTITCTVTFEDKGNPPSSDTATVTITVIDQNDEPPSFDYKYYYSEVSSVLTEGDPLVILPSEISASDGDTGLNAAITYTMTNANPDVPGTDYFAINRTTGEVTLVKDLKDDFLLNERVLFFVEAHEDIEGEAQVVLEVRLPWVYLVCGGFHFEQAVYSAEIFDQSSGEIVRVVAVTNSTEEPTYTLRGEGSQHFSIDANTGMISVNQADPPPVDLYEMEAVAAITSVPSEQATTEVSIHVLPLSLDEVAITNSVIRASVPEGEGEQELGSVTLSDTANIVCVSGAEPKNLRDRFTVEKKTGKEWTLKKSGALDYEQSKEVMLYLKAYTSEAPEDCENIDLEIPLEFLKSEAVAIITVTDINDEAPAFSSDDLVAAYPVNEALRRAAGPVVSVQAIDKDTVDVRYSLTGEDADKFTVDEVTGDVYPVEGMTCEPPCEFTVKASDGSKEDQIKVQVLPLDTDHVFTILLPNTALSEVDGKLEELSQKAGVQISMLYVSLTDTTARWGRTRRRRETTMDVMVHVYSIKDGALMTRDELNSALSNGSSTLQAEEFIDAEVFEGVEPVDTTGLKAAVGVLGALLGIVLIAGVSFFVYKKKRGKAAPSKERPPTPISTLGQAYHNGGYTTDNGPSQVNLGSGSVGHKSNGSLNGYPSSGSLNGYTSAEIHRHPDQESPPLHRSPLAPPTESIPLRPRDNQQQGGLKRTDAGAPEYYGSSSAAPPPYFSSSSSPAYPIYAEIKPKKYTPSTDSKPRNISDDEDDITDTKFASAKSSPPPRRRSNKEDDEDDDEGGDVAYPGGKHTDSQKEPAEEEKKSVAFKLKVETKEIEAENMGPAQKKAEVTKLMEANRKKLEEEGEDKDGDEEEQEGGEDKGDDEEEEESMRL